MGTAVSMDPCATYHLLLHKNLMPKECFEFWNALDEAAWELECLMVVSDSGDVYLIRRS